MPNNHEQHHQNESNLDTRTDERANAPPHPQIYAASLSDYNKGRLHGEWIDAAQEPDNILRDIDEMLAKSTHQPAEEWAIHDYQNFGTFALHEYENVQTVSALGLGIEEHGPVFSHFAHLIGTDALDESKRF